MIYRKILGVLVCLLGAFPSQAAKDGKGDLLISGYCRASINIYIPPVIQWNITLFCGDPMEPMYRTCTGVKKGGKCFDISVDDLNYENKVLYLPPNFLMALTKEIYQINQPFVKVVQLWDLTKQSIIKVYRYQSKEQPTAMAFLINQLDKDYLVVSYEGGIIKYIEVNDPLGDQYLIPSYQKGLPKLHQYDCFEIISYQSTFVSLNRTPPRKGVYYNIATGKGIRLNLPISVTTPKVKFINDSKLGILLRYSLEIYDLTQHKITRKINLTCSCIKNYLGNCFVGYKVIRCDESYVCVYDMLTGKWTHAVKFDGREKINGMFPVLTEINAQSFGLIDTYRNLSKNQKAESELIVWNIKEEGGNITLIPYRSLYNITSYNAGAAVVALKYLLIPSFDFQNMRVNVYELKYE